MTFTLNNIIQSLAGVLKSNYDYPIYLSPNQQGTDFPCFFIFFTPSTVENKPMGRYFRDLGMDIVFVQQRNIVNGNAAILEIAEYLDKRLDLFDYMDGVESAKVRTYERRWQIEDDELHYQFHIRQRVSLPRAGNHMQGLEENNAGIKKSGTETAYGREEKVSN